MRIFLQFDQDGDAWLKADTDKLFEEWISPGQLLEKIAGDVSETTTLVIENYTISKVVDDEPKST